MSKLQRNTFPREERYFIINEFLLIQQIDVLSQHPETARKTTEDDILYFRKEAAGARLSQLVLFVVALRESM